MPVVQGVKEDQADIPPAGLASYKREQDKLTDDLRRQALQGVLRQHQLHGRAGRPRGRCARPAGPGRRTRSSSSPATTATTSGEHGLWQKMSLFEESSPRAAADRRPGRRRQRGRRRSRPSRQVDLFPTLAELCGVKTPGEPAGPEPGADAQGPVRRRPRLGPHAGDARRRTRTGRRSRPTSAPKGGGSSATACAPALAIHRMGRGAAGPRALRPRRRSARI